MNTPHLLEEKKFWGIWVLQVVGAFLLMWVFFGPILDATFLAADAVLPVWGKVLTLLLMLLPIWLYQMVGVSALPQKAPWSKVGLVLGFAYIWATGPAVALAAYVVRSYPILQKVKWVSLALLTVLLVVVMNLLHTIFFTLANGRLVERIMQIL